MTPQPNQQVPLAFIDRTGYVTPFNGIMDRTLDGWYIYDDVTLKKALEQMRRLEEDRVRDEIGIIDVQYSVNEEDSEATGIGQDAPEFARDIFGVEKAVPFLNMGKQAPAMDLVPGQVPEIIPPPPPPVQTTTVDHLHVTPDNENLSEDEMTEMSEKALNPNQVAAAIMGL
jgi:hypothetical protein|nr:MAG TPA: hypothetical protein [Caudoviricetes sp.]